MTGKKSATCKISHHKGLQIDRWWPQSLVVLLTSLFISLVGVSDAVSEMLSDRMQLWRAGAFKGTVIELRAFNEDVDREGFLGPAGTQVGPVYTQQDFDEIASSGANLVVISHPGLYRVDPPYKLDNAFARSLDSLMDMALQADLFVVIEPRTGPGRSEFTHYLDELGTWFGEEQLNDGIWGKKTAKERWAEMLRVTARRYERHRAFAGLATMAFPNGNITGPDALNNPIMETDPERFDVAFGGAQEDWNLFQPQLVRAIRQLNVDVPIILVPGNGGDPAWLPYMELSLDDRLVVGLNWVDPPTAPQLSASVISDFKETYPQVPLVSLRSMVARDRPDAQTVMGAHLDLFEQQSMSFAIGLWQSDWLPYAEDRHLYAFRFGSDLDVRQAIDNAPLEALYRRYWSGTLPRPSQLIRDFR